MKGFEYKAEECRLSERDWELLGIIEKESHEEASVWAREWPLLSTSAWL